MVKDSFKTLEPESSSILGLENSHFWDIKQDMGGITVFEHESSRYKLIKHNDTSYLNQIQKHTLDDF